MNDNLTTEQKIDIIYDKIIARERREKTWLFIKWWFRLFILLYLWYFFLFGLPKLMENIKTAMTPNIAEINLPEWFSEKFWEFIGR